MKNLKILITLIFASVALVSCASMQPNATIQEVTVITKPSDGFCTLTNKLGSVKVKSPDVATVNRSGSNLEVDCTKGHLKGSASIPAGVNPKFGSDGLGLVGNLVDLSTGAGNEYPAIIRIDLK